MSIVPWIKITWALIPHIVRSPELWKLWNCALLTSHHVVAHFGASTLAALIQMWTPVGVFREYLISVPESYVEHKSYVDLLHVSYPLPSNPAAAVLSLHSFCITPDTFSWILQSTTNAWLLCSTSSLKSGRNREVFQKAQIMIEK